MVPLSIQSSVEYAKTLIPETIVRSVSNVQTTISRRILPLPQSQARPYKVRTPSQSRTCVGLMASSLDELLDKVSSAFLLTCQFLSLVLEEDGTVVDSEAFFQSLPPNTPLMVLENGEKWTPSKPHAVVGTQPWRSGIAKLTLDLYKLNPKDFIGCLTIKATLYEMYTLSYDIKCTRAKDFLKCLLRCATCLANMGGQLLLFTSSYIMQFIGEDEC